MDFLGGSIWIGRLFDVNIRVHVLYLLWMVFRLAQDAAGWQESLAFIGMLFAIVLIHEFGHCLGARWVGGYAHEILMWPLGGLAFAHAPMTPWAQFVTVACGPLVNLIFCVASAGVLIASTGNWLVCSPSPFSGPGFTTVPEAWQWYLWMFYHVNLLLLCFNLLPIYPLDGGQLFMTLIWPFSGLHRATDIACKTGICGAILLAVVGTQREVFVLVAIAVFCGITCWQRLQALRYGMVVDERIASIDFVRRQRRPSLWSRLLGRRPGRPPAGPGQPRAEMNPNPGGWEHKLARQAELEAELDRILQKVHEQGIRSLSYTERQILERATRERQARERAFDRDTHV